MLFGCKKPKVQDEDIDDAPKVTREQSTGETGQSNTVPFSILENPAKELDVFPLKIPDGSLIVMKKGKHIGLVIINDQKSDPETCSYKWYYRQDGQYTFKDDKKFTTGEVKDTKSIKFGVFDCDWSINTEKIGFIYFEYNEDNQDNDKQLWLGVVLDPDPNTLGWNLWGLNLISASTPTINLEIDFGVGSE